MLHPSTKKLIDRLSEMTLQRKIDWVSSDMPDTLAYDTDGYRVLLEGNPASLVLCNSLGTELDRADVDVLAATKHIDGGTYETLMSSMRDEASRIARGAEEAIANVLGGLDLDGDGIPDVPAPIALEEAPDGPTAEASDDIEDAADEMSAAIDVSEDLPEDLPEDLEDIAETADLNIPQEIEETPVSNGLDAGQTLAATGLAAAGAATIASVSGLGTTNDEAHAEETAEAGEARAEIALNEEALEETPDIGRAVADLAEQVNRAPQAEPDTTDKYAKASNFLTSTTSFGSITGNTLGGSIVQETVPATTPADPQAEPDITPDTPAEPPVSAESGLQAASLSAEPLTTSGAPFSGETISLSGLANAPSGHIGTASMSELQMTTPSQETVSPVADAPLATQDADLLVDLELEAEAGQPEFEPATDTELLSESVDAPDSISEMLPDVPSDSAEIPAMPPEQVLSAPEIDTPAEAVIATVAAPQETADNVTEQAAESFAPATEMIADTPILDQEPEAAQISETVEQIDITAEAAAPQTAEEPAPEITPEIPPEIPQEIAAEPRQEQPEEITSPAAPDIIVDDIPAAPAPPSDAEVEEELADAEPAPQTPKRFNPWI